MSRSVFIVGAGAVGGSIGRALAARGIRIAGVHCRSSDHASEGAAAIGAPAFSGELPREIRDAETVLVAVPDTAIEQVAGDAVEAAVVSAEQVWLHCAGGLSAEALAPLAGRVRGTGTLHPAMAFPRGRVTDIPPGVGFAVDGDPAAIEAANELVDALEGIPVRVGPERRAAYHAATVLASNYLVALLAEARAALTATGLSDREAERLLASLGSSALAAVSEIGIDSALTGPIERGDATTVEHHLEALAASPDAQSLYRELGRATLRVARDDLSEDQVDALSRILDPDADD